MQRFYTNHITSHLDRLHVRKDELHERLLKLAQTPPSQITTTDLNLALSELFAFASHQLNLIDALNNEVCSLNEKIASQDPPR